MKREASSVQKSVLTIFIGSFLFLILISALAGRSDIQSSAAFFSPEVRSNGVGYASAVVTQIDRSVGCVKQCDWSDENGDGLAEELFARCTSDGDVGLCGTNCEGVLYDGTIADSHNLCADVVCKCN